MKKLIYLVCLMTVLFTKAPVVGTTLNTNNLVQEQPATTSVEEIDSLGIGI